MFVKHLGSSSAVYQKSQKRADNFSPKGSKCRQVAQSIKSLWAAFIEFFLILLLIFALTFGISLKGSGAIASSSVALNAITSSVAFFTLVATVLAIGKYMSNQASNISLEDHNNRNWQPLNDAHELN